MKKKIFIIALAACLFALSIAGSSIAYFTDVEEATNVFTTGDVNITLTYKGNVVENDDDDDTNNAFELSSHVYPGQTYAMDATISNVGSEDAYVGAIITLTGENIGTLVSDTNPAADPLVFIGEVLTGLTTGSTVKYVLNGDTLTIYVIKTDALTKGSGSCVIFEDVVIPAKWDHTQMNVFAGLELNVKAYATQTVGFNSAAAALEAAFSNANTASNTDWTNYFNP